MPDSTEYKLYERVCKGGFSFRKLAVHYETPKYLGKLTDLSSLNALSIGKECFVFEFPLWQLLTAHFPEYKQIEAGKLRNIGKLNGLLLVNENGIFLYASGLFQSRNFFRCNEMDSVLLKFEQFDEYLKAWTFKYLNENDSACYAPTWWSWAEFQKIDFSIDCSESVFKQVSIFNDFWQKPFMADEVKATAEQIEFVHKITGGTLISVRNIENFHLLHYNQNYFGPQDSAAELTAMKAAWFTVAFDSCSKEYLYCTDSNSIWEFDPSFEGVCCGHHTDFFHAVNTENEE